MTEARTEPEPCRPYRAGTRDIVFVFLIENTLADCCRREFAFVPDQTLLALARPGGRLGRIIVADPWRWGPGGALRSLRAGGEGHVVGRRGNVVQPWRGGR